MLHNNLVELSQHFQILDDVGVLVRDEHQEQLLDRHIDVPDHICLYVRALLARFDQLREVSHVFL